MAGRKARNATLDPAWQRSVCRMAEGQGFPDTCVARLTAHLSCRNIYCHVKMYNDMQLEQLLGDPPSLLGKEVESKLYPMMRQVSSSCPSMSSQAPGVFRMVLLFSIELFERPNLGKK